MAVLQSYDKMERKVEKVEKHHASETWYRLRVCAKEFCMYRTHLCVRVRICAYTRGYMRVYTVYITSTTRSTATNQK